MGKDYSHIKASFVTGEDELAFPAFDAEPVRFKPQGWPTIYTVDLRTPDYLEVSYTTARDDMLPKVGTEYRLTVDNVMTDYVVTELEIDGSNYVGKLERNDA